MGKKSIKNRAKKLAKKSKTKQPTKAKIAQPSGAHSRVHHRSSSSHSHKKATPGQSPDKTSLSNKYRYASTTRKTKKLEKSHKKAVSKSQYLSTLPKSRAKRLVHYAHPKRFVQFWFSWQGFKLASKMAAIGTLLVIIVAIGIIAHFRRGLDIDEINRKDLSQTTIFYDRTGEKELYRVFQDENRTVLEEDQISPYVRDATVAIEDKDFYNHKGFSFQGIFRAVYNNSTGGSQQGGSTLTQQFIKKRLLTSERTYTRKIKELVLAVELENRYTKDEILTLYLNQVPYGGVSYGIEAGSVYYFGKPAKDLNLEESAFLAAMPQSPTYYNPLSTYYDAELLKGRYITVLDAMAEQGYITQEEADGAKDFDYEKVIAETDRSAPIEDVIAPHFVFEAKARLEAQVGSQMAQAGGLKVITTLDYDTQKMVEETVKTYVDNGTLGYTGANNTAIVLQDPATGEVIAMMGSKDYFDTENDGQVNVATSLRQPGSSFKPYVYASLFQSESWGPGSPIYDVETVFTVPPDPEYKPKNADGKFKGRMTVRDALATSKNIPAVKAGYINGPQSAVDLAEDLGVGEMGGQTGLSTALGTRELRMIDHVNAYSAFANGGVQAGQDLILKATTPSGEVVMESSVEKSRVIDEEAAYLINDVLSDEDARSNLFGAGSSYAYVNGLNLALKTGTTNTEDEFGQVREKDAWMMSYTPNLSASIWSGRTNDNLPTNGGYTFNGSVMMEVMRRYHEGLSNVKDFERPSGIKEYTIDLATGREAKEGCRNCRKDIFPSWYEPHKVDPNAKVVTIDKISGKEANECTPELAKVKATDAGVVPEIPPTDPLFANWAKAAGYSAGASSISGKDDVHKCSDKKPQVSVSASEVNNSGKFKITAKVTKGTHSLKEAVIKIDGAEMQRGDNIAGGGNFTYTTEKISGSARVTVEVIDDALYSASASTTIKSQPSSSSDKITISVPSSGASTNPTNTTVSWSSVSDADGYKLCAKTTSTATWSCSSSSSTSATIASLDPGENYQLYVEATDGGSVIPGSRSATRQFSTQ